MSPADRGYYQERLNQERARAAAARQPEIRRAHSELARCYAALLGEAPVSAAA